MFTFDRNSLNGNDNFNDNEEGWNPINDVISPNESVPQSPSPRMSSIQGSSPNKAISISPSPKKSARCSFSSTADEPNYEFEQSLAKLTARSESPDLFADDSHAYAACDHLEAR